jgi:glucosamine--fructose-6-phosphate aminotransferase (isomerizing)
MSQPEVWASVLADGERVEAAARFVRGTGTTSAAVVGCGSSFYLAQVVAAALNRAGWAALPLPASEALLAWPDHALAPQTLLVAVSRSGETTEVLWAVDQHRLAARGPVLAITCEGGSTVAGAADHAIVLPEASEQSMVMTRSFSSMLLAALMLACELGGGEVSAYAELPEQCRRTLDASDALYGAEDIALLGEHVFVLASGCAYGIAQEAALKLMEVSLTRAQAFHHLEFRHGPKSMVDAQTLVVSLATSDVARHEPLLVGELERYGASVLRLGSDPSTLHVPVAAARDTLAEALLRLAPMQLLALRRAEARGIDPDAPRHLDAVVQLRADEGPGHPADTQPGGRPHV